MKPLTGEIAFASIDDIAKRLRDRELRSQDLTQHLLERIATVDPTLHSYLNVMGESALREAKAADDELDAGNCRGPLHGVPLGVKDLCDIEGMPTTCASRVLDAPPATRDATVVQRLRSAGAVVLGKLNLTEFALSGYHPDFPVPLNPWNPELHPGGSSSGSGVAVAAGLCFGAIGTDTGGSIRLPSAWNGVVGLKPTYGRVSRHGVFPLSHSLDHIGAMTRRVADAARMYAAMAGYDPNDPTSLTASVTTPKFPSRPPSLRGLRIGYDDEYATAPTMPDVSASIRDVRDALADLGAEIVDVKVPLSNDTLQAWFVLCAADTLIDHEPLVNRRRADYGTTFGTFLDYAKTIDGLTYARAHRNRIEFAGALRAMFDRCDALLCPGAFSTAPPAAAVGPQDPFTPEIAPFLRFTGPFNFSGSPTLSVPAGFSPEGMPYGFQLVGHHLGEATILRIGHAYELATRHWHRRPPCG